MKSEIRTLGRIYSDVIYEILIAIGKPTMPKQLEKIRAKNNIIMKFKIVLIKPYNCKLFIAIIEDCNNDILNGIFIRHKIELARYISLLLQFNKLYWMLKNTSEIAEIIIPINKYIFPYLTNSFLYSITDVEYDFANLGM